MSARGTHPAAAAQREDLVLELAASGDGWRDRIERLNLPAPEARALRIRVLAARCFNVTRVTGRARAERLARSARTKA